MKPSPFEYHVPHSVDEALALLAEHGSDAKPLAGGQSLIPAMNFRLATPAVLVDLNAIADLQFIRPDNGGVVIGSMTRQRTVERSALIADAVPLLRETMPFIAHPAIRTRGTVGGSLAHADPAAELPAVMVALDAQIQLRGTAGARRVPASEFFTGLFTTAIESGELLTAIEIPALLGEGAPKGPPYEGPPYVRRGWAFQEISRRHGDFALAGVAALVELGADGRCTSGRIVLFSVGDRPMLAHHATRQLVGQMPTAETIRAAADTAARQDIDPTSDIHASSRYRRHLASVLTRRVLERAFDRARHHSSSKESR